MKSNGGVREAYLLNCKSFRFFFFPKVLTMIDGKNISLSDNSTVKTSYIVYLRVNNFFLFCLNKSFITITFFRLLSSSLSPCLSQRFGHCTLRPSSGGWNVELSPLKSFNLKY